MKFIGILSEEFLWKGIGGLLYIIKILNVTYIHNLAKTTLWKQSNLQSSLQPNDNFMEAERYVVLSNVHAFKRKEKIWFW